MKRFYISPVCEVFLTDQEEDLLLAIRDAGSADMRQLRILIFVRNVERDFDRRR